MGVALPSLFGPMAVPYDETYDDSVPVPQSVINDTQDDIHAYMIWLAAAAAVIFVVILIYFPDRPPVPASKSGAVERTDFVAGWKMVLTNKSIWLVCLAYAIPGGIQIGFQVS